MATVKYSVSAYTADGTTTDYLITWDYLDDDHITVEVDGVSNDDPTANHTFVKLNDTTVRVTDGIGGAIAAGSQIQIRRNTPITTRPISFADGSALLASDLNKNSDYLLYAMQEALDEVDFTVQYQEEAEGFKDATEALRDETQVLRDATQVDTNAADAHRIAAALSETNAATSATNAATSETNAATSETNAASSAVDAQVSSTSAYVSKNAAANSAIDAATSETNAAASAAAAAASEAGVAADAATATAEAAAAATSEANALIYKNNASTSATNAATSESNSASSASAAALSATNAAGSATAAGISEGNAQTYATNSQASAAAASTAELNAEASEVSAATSATNAAASETSVADNATAAATSEANALTYASNASTSASQAAASAQSIAGYDLGNIAATITDTAVDIFVYDTRKDSDGGAWRKRTQGTSWYNETLNTATRGSRKEFPAVAVIVADASSDEITIYDGDDPDLPMWMVFPLGASTLVRTPTVSAVAMLNAKMVATDGDGYAGSTIDFILDGKDRDRDLRDSVNYNNIANRATGHISNNTTRLVNNYANDVAMTVLPNAPIDAATGLPVPTIAVATDGGVSVIKDDGTVVSGHTGVAAEHIMLHESGALVYGVTGAGNDNFSLHLDLGNTTRDTFYDARTNEGVYDTYLNEGSGECLFEGNEFDLALAQSKGLLRVAEQPDFSTGLHNRITSTYNTGWMNGDIKLATLSDTDATNVTGSELVTNGNMEANNSWEAVGTPTASGQTSAQAHSGTYSWYFTGDGNYDGIQSSVDFSITSGKAYVIDAWVYPVNDTGITLKFGGVNRTVTGLTQGAWNQVTETIVSTQTTTAGNIGFNTDISWGGGTWYIDDVSVRLAEEDRSVNGNGLQVFGTVTKSAVATGADLVGYSGFSTSNYLEQPYNSDLDFGTGDFAVTFWAKMTTWSGYIFDRADSGGGNRFAIYTGSLNSGTVYFYTTTANVGSSEISATVAHNNWFQCTAVRRSNGLQQIYINGELVTSVSKPVRDISNTDAQLYLGVRYSLATALTGSMALLRISGTAPSPEQIKKIYEDEKFLFQDNAQATLYGSSDAVTALAYDDTTELLHVGTSAGRSVFQGLRRVDNTTDAVGAAISASNGLVAED